MTLARRLVRVHAYVVLIPCRSTALTKLLQRQHQQCAVICNDLTALYFGAQQRDVAVLDDQVAMHFMVMTSWSKRNLSVSNECQCSSCTHQLHQGHVCRVMALGRHAFLDNWHCAMGSKQFMHDVCRLHGMHCAKNHAAGEMQICSFNFDVMMQKHSDSSRSQRLHLTKRCILIEKTWQPAKLHAGSYQTTTEYDIMHLM